MVYYKFYDDFGNMATITERMVLPYNGSKRREKAYVLSLYAMYDNGMMYHLSMYDNLTDVFNELKHFSCGTFQAQSSLI